MVLGSQAEKNVGIEGSKIRLSLLRPVEIMEPFVRMLTRSCQALKLKLPIRTQIASIFRNCKVLVQSTSRNNKDEEKESWNFAL